MNTSCQEGLRLRRRFEKELKQWGLFDAYERAVEILPVGLQRAAEFQKEVKNAESALFKARYMYVEHMARCLECSKVLVVPNAVSIVCEKLRKLSEESGDSSFESHSAKEDPLAKPNSPK